MARAKTEPTPAIQVMEEDAYAMGEFSHSRPERKKLPLEAPTEEMAWVERSWNARTKIGLDSGMHPWTPKQGTRLYGGGGG